MILLRTLSVLIFLFGIGCLYVGIGGLLIIEDSIAIMKQMREAGSATLDHVDLSGMEVVLYVTYSLTTLIGLAATISGSGMFFKRNWARILWIGTIILMSVWSAYALVMNFVNQMVDVNRLAGYTITATVFVSLLYYYLRKETKRHFEVS